MGQSATVAFGAGVALAYAAAVSTVGASALTLVFRSSRPTFLERRAPFWLLGFVTGQGLVGLLALVAGLLGGLSPTLVGVFVVLGCAVGITGRRAWPGRAATAKPARPGPDRAVGIGLLALVALRGIASLLPTRNDDALLLYLFTARTIAATGRVAFEPYVLHNGLLPLQVELHWAALFTLANETAVTVWDWLCAASFLGLLHVTARQVARDSRVADVAALVVATSSAFTLLIGNAKSDNAAAQFALAAFTWLLIGRDARVVACSGLCLGWAVASRYTSALFVVPWLILLAWRLREPSAATIRVLVAGASGLLAGAGPMLLKNVLLVGHPFAPLMGEPGAFWVWRDAAEAQRNLAWNDVWMWPFVASFAERPAMLGNISPLFLGLLPFWILARAHPAVRPANFLLGLGAIELVLWIAVHPLALEPRFHLAAFAMAAIPLAAGFVVTLDAASGPMSAVLRAGPVALLAFWIAVSAWTALVAGGYAAGRHTRAERMGAKPGYEVAQWLNHHVKADERVSVRNLSSFRYFVRPDILEGSETRVELQRVWDDRGVLGPRPWDPAEWRATAAGRFRYVVVRIQDVPASLASAAAAGIAVEAAFFSGDYAVLRVNGWHGPGLREGVDESRLPLR